MKTYAYGFPRLGKKREYKKIIEGFWAGKVLEPELRRGLDALQKEMLAQYEAHVDFFPVGEISGYDPLLDLAISLGVYTPKNMQEYYELCRGKNALEMTKWFNTNYHYLVPDFSEWKEPKFKLGWNKPKEYLDKFKQGIPALIGPFTLLKLSKGIPQERFEEFLLAAGNVVREMLKNCQEVHIEEGAFAMELTTKEIQGIQKVYQAMIPPGVKVHLFTYYDSVDFLKELFLLPVASIGLDFVNGPRNLENIRKMGFPREKRLIAGLVNGRNVWRTDLEKAVQILSELAKITPNLWVSNAAPLYHLPVGLDGETLDPRLLKQLAFAKERLKELKLIADRYEGKKTEPWWQEPNVGFNKTVQQRIKQLTAGDFKKATPFAQRMALQRNTLNLPPFPTTTIGSFPQTADVRKKRAEFREGKITEKQYQGFVREKIAEAIKTQEDLGLDVLVHGEFERTDMVEFFAEKLEGIATTNHGWIISYGTRGYRPPIIYGDVSRPAPMTVEEITYAQSLTKKPVKGMLTGPVTILAWSFVREDVPISDVAYQLALCLQDEIRDYEKAGIKIAQIDEPAFREKAPMKKRDWNSYFDWAIKSFRLTTNTKPETQIHSHMCYSEFGEIIDKIAQMDFDVISIEATRSHGDVIASFEKVKFDRQIGLGVWDIHSPAVPKVEEMKKIAQRALQVIPKENFWINPDCGLKTRQWEETLAALKNITALSKELR